MNDRDKIIAKYVAGECSEDEKSTLSKWAASDTKNANYLRKMQKIWESSEISIDAFNPDIDGAWYELSTKINAAPDQRKTSSNTGFWFLSRAAAVLIFTIGIGFVAYKLYFNDNSTNNNHIIFESNQEQKNTAFTLADGTTVWISANSKIRYPETFNDNVREVFLEGMAFFDVISNPDKPFIIHTPESTTEVLGTAFNLRAYRHDDKVTLTVVSGTVSLSGTDEDQKPLLITKDEKGILSKKTNMLSKEPNDDLNFMAWRTGKIQFKEAVLEDAILQLNQHYGMNIVLNTPTPQKCLLTATFDNQSPEEVLDVIETIFEATRENNDSTIVLTATGC